MSLQTTNSNLMKMAESSPKGLKTLWEKEKLLIVSNFSFSHSVRLVPQTSKIQGLFGKGLKDLGHIVLLSVSLSIRLGKLKVKI